MMHWALPLGDRPEAARGDNPAAWAAFGVAPPAPIIPISHRPRAEEQTRGPRTVRCAEQCFVQFHEIMQFITG